MCCIIIPATLLHTVSDETILDEYGKDLKIKLFIDTNKIKELIDSHNDSTIISVHATSIEFIARNEFYEDDPDEEDEYFTCLVYGEYSAYVSININNTVTLFMKSDYDEYQKVLPVQDFLKLL